MRSLRRPRSVTSATLSRFITELYSIGERIDILGRIGQIGEGRITCGRLEPLGIVFVTINITRHDYALLRAVCWYVNVCDFNAGGGNLVPCFTMRLNVCNSDCASSKWLTVLVLFFWMYGTILIVEMSSSIRILLAIRSDMLLSEFAPIG